jgi:tRNA(adenine34) deaminase
VANDDKAPLGVGVDEYFMREALRQARLAYDAGEVPVGAVVVWDNKIIARGHNQVEQLNDSTAHAEMIALTAAFNSLGSKYLPDGVLYVTVEPCLMCCGAMYWSKIGRIVYGAEDIKNGYRKVTEGNWPFHQKAELSSGVLAGECAQLMKDFFAERRPPSPKGGPEIRPQE